MTFAMLTYNSSALTILIKASQPAMMMRHFGLSSIATTTTTTMTLCTCAIVVTFVAIVVVAAVVDGNSSGEKSGKALGVTNSKRANDHAI